VPDGSAAAGGGEIAGDDLIGSGALLLGSFGRIAEVVDVDGRAEVRDERMHLLAAEILAAEEHYAAL
jgi:hypothetical protein